MTFGVRHRWLAVGLGVIVVVAIGVWLFWPSAPKPAPPRERAYREFTACLLTDDRGLTGEPAGSAWSGMQHASVANSVKVQYLSVTGPQTGANAEAYFNSLGLQRCAMVIAVGEAPISAVMAGKDRFSNVVYVIVGGAPGALGVTTVDTSSPDQVKARVDSLVDEAASAAK